MSTENWKLESDLCRCCHSKGKYKNLAEPCYNLGQQEIYADMIRDCFNIDIEPVPGMLCAVTYTICDACIARVRDAFNFRKQVETCEEHFRDMYNKDIIKVGGSNLQVKVKEEFLDSTTQKCDYKIELSTDEDENDEDLGETFDLKCNDDEDSDDTLDVIKKRPKKENASKTKRPTKKTVKQKVVKEEAAETSGEDLEKKKVAGGSKCIHNIYDDYLTKSKEDDGTLTYGCKVCGKNFKLRAYFRQHYKHVHMKQRPKKYACLMCDEKFVPHLRASHMEKVHGIPAPQCNICGKKFAFPFKLLKHQRVYHRGEKQFECNKCGMKFAASRNLRIHMAKHSNLRPYCCDICRKCFKWKSNLKYHKMIHLDEKNCKCLVCDRGFVQSSSLKYHIKKHHPELV